MLARPATEGHTCPAAVSMTTVALGEHAVHCGMLALAPEGLRVYVDMAQHHVDSCINYTGSPT